MYVIRNKTNVIGFFPRCGFYCIHDAGQILPTPLSARGQADGRRRRSLTLLLCLLHLRAALTRLS